MEEPLEGIEPIRWDANLESNIEEKIGLKVFIRNRKNNSGQVTFQYNDLDQLNRLMTIIKSNY